MAKSLSPVGVSVATTETGPKTLHGRTISLNYKMCDYLDVPSRDPELHMDHNRPTVQVPGPGQINKNDLVCLWNNLKVGKIVISSVPVPRHDKISSRLDEHMNMIKNRFPDEIVKDHIKKIVNGPVNDGGYNKLELLELLRDTEERNPLTNRGGLNRPEVLLFLKQAIDYVRQSQGGISNVKDEDYVPPVVPDSSNAPIVRAKVNPKSFLGDLSK